jgi:hypothetical protein
MKPLLLFFFLSLSLAGFGQDTTNVLKYQSTGNFTINGNLYLDDTKPIYDTVAVWIEYADTTKPISYNMTVRGYEVRVQTGGYIQDSGIDVINYWSHPMWSTVAYLDKFKKPLPFLVWMSKERREK